MGTASAAAIGIALSPIPVLAVAALLASGNALRSASAFVAGQALAVGGVTALVVVAAAGSLERSLDGSLALLEIGIAVLLAILLVAHARGTRDRSASERVLEVLDGVRTRVAFVWGFVLVGLNPKNLALALAGGAAIVELDASVGSEAAAVLIFTAVAMSVLAAELLAYAIAPGRAARALARGRQVALRHERLVVNAVLAGLAALFLVRGLLDLLR